MGGNILKRLMKTGLTEFPQFRDSLEIMSKLLELPRAVTIPLLILLDMVIKIHTTLLPTTITETI